MKPLHIELCKKKHSFIHTTIYILCCCIRSSFVDNFSQYPVPKILEVYLPLNMKKKNPDYLKIQYEWTELSDQNTSFHYNNLTSLSVTLHVVTLIGKIAKPFLIRVYKKKKKW